VCTAAGVADDEGVVVDESSAGSELAAEVGGIEVAAVDETPA